MRSRRYTPQSADRPRRAGFSFIELLATMGITGILMAGVVQFFTNQAHGMRAHESRIETQQALRAALDAVGRDVRLAGACLPKNGEFMALDGADGGDADTIIVRSGLTKSDLSCVFGTTSVVAAPGTKTFQVDDATGFVKDKLAYVRDPNGSGELQQITGVGAKTVTVSPGAGQQYPAGSTIYAVDERIYTLDAMADPPVLMLAVDQQPPMPFAIGIRSLDIQYVLDRNCPSCDVVDLSTALTTAEWWLVNEVMLEASAAPLGGAIAPEDLTTLTKTTRAKPRNLLP